MKKFVVSILAILYFSASSGVVLNVHYCMGHISSVKVDNFSLKSCTCGSNEPKSDCCSNEFKVLKVNNSHNAAIAGYAFNLPVAPLPSYISFIDHSKLTSQQADQPVAHGPPDISSPHIYILQCVFRV